MNWYLKVLRQYADFKGRARRKEFWMFTLFHTIFYIALVILDNLLGTTRQGVFSFGWLESIYYWATFVPTLAVTCRRLHDIGKSGWWNLLIFVLLVGWIILTVWRCKDSQAGENKYGTNPKE
jgi:uncharacterized membrane protein YhaH (DUF805 family)